MTSTSEVLAGIVGIPAIAIIVPILMWVVMS